MIWNHKKVPVISGRFKRCRYTSGDSTHPEVTSPANSPKVSPGPAEMPSFPEETIPEVNPELLFLAKKIYG